MSIVGFKSIITGDKVVAIVSKLSSLIDNECVFENWLSKILVINKFVNLKG